MNNNTNNHAKQIADASWSIQPPSSEGWTRLYIGNTDSHYYHTVTHAFDSKEICLERARLIAAAPDLLEALECFANIPGIEQYGFDSEVAQARAAIAKARGEVAQEAAESTDYANKPVVFEQWSVSDIREEMEHSCHSMDDLLTLRRLNDDQLYELLERIAWKGHSITDGCNGGLMLSLLEEIAVNYFANEP